MTFLFSHVCFGFSSLLSRFPFITWSTRESCKARRKPKVRCSTVDFQFSFAPRYVIVLRSRLLAQVWFLCTFNIILSRYFFSLRQLSCIKSFNSNRWVLWAIVSHFQQFFKLRRNHRQIYVNWREDSLKIKCIKLCSQNGISKRSHQSEIARWSLRWRQMRPSEAKKVSTRIIWSETKKLKLKVSSASQPHVLIGSQSPPDTKQSIPPICGLQKMLLVPFRFDSEVLVLVSCKQFFSSLLSAVLSMKSTGIEI